MNLRFWLLVAFLMSRIGLFEAALQCQTAEYSIGGVFLRGHTFKTCKIEWNESCYFRCAEEVTCQSYNFLIDQNLCELNNRTKEARPEDFKQDQRRFYMKRAINRGKLPFSLITCLSLFSNTAIFNSGFRGVSPGAVDSPTGFILQSAWLRHDGLQSYMLTSHGPEEINQDCM